MIKKLRFREAIMADMGTVRTTVGVENVSQLGGIREFPETLVDTGSEFTWIPRAVLESLDIKVQRRQGFIVADGRHLERDIGYAIVHAAGFATADDVVFAEADDLVVLGVRSIEGLNLRVDVVRKQLVEAGPVIAANISQEGPVSEAGIFNTEAGSGRQTTLVAL
jgi:predicted aspartyl protease